MTELDKFKRRLVRSVARLLQQSPEEQEVAWEQMRKETGCDCKLLWERMRALTVKKMKRLLAADDRNENIAAVARMSVTDWLLFDLVLVHEKLDVIGRDEIGKGKCQTERPILGELFNLVLEHDIERKTGDQLLDAWAALTRYYNSRGRICSPMLLQKRWYQLKEVTRVNFYKLWNNYRGNQRLWDDAKLAKPTPLQGEIAKKFPHIITQPFAEWEELILQKKIILPEQFEIQHRLRTRPKTVDDKPDVVLIEPVIETIELADDDDDSDQNTTNNDDAQSSAEVNLGQVKLEKVKQEPIEDGLSNVQILETAHVSSEFYEDSNSSSYFSSLGVNEANRENIAQQMSNFIEATGGDATVCTDQVSEVLTIDGAEAGVIKAEKSYDDVPDKIPDGTPDDIPDDTPDDIPDDTPDDIPDEIPDDTPDDIPDDLIKQKAYEYFRSKIEKTLQLGSGEETNAVGDDNAKNTDNDDIVDDIIKQKADDFVRKVDIKKLAHDVVDDMKLPTEFDDEGIEFVDDGIEYVEDDDDDNVIDKIKEELLDPVIKTEVKEDKEDEIEEKKSTEDAAPSPKFDLKLLMEPVVYTTKLDDMIIFKGKKFDFVEFQNVIDSVIIESKPVSKLAVKVEVEDDGNNGVYSQSNLSQSDIVDNDHSTRNDSVTPTNVTPTTNAPLNKDLLENNSNVPNDEDLNDTSRRSSTDDYESDEQIDESLKVKGNSYLLQKPKNRSYNPIILCKNPDFNTRLKRLTAGFFSSTRNRQLLNACKPMTVDVHKAFEHKLINGTLYIKSSGENSQTIKEETENAQTSSVMPSAMSVQSLLTNDKTNISELISSSQMDTVDLTQRSKTINLRDLSEIRRINQHLLTAQVPPMRVETAGYVDNSLPASPPPLVEIDDVEIDSNKAVDEADELKIISISGGQVLHSNYSGPVRQPKEEPHTDIVPTSYRGRGRGRGRGNYSRGTQKRPPYIPKYPTYPSKITAPWLQVPQSKSANMDDFLITIDTLNRMINKLHGTEEFKNPTQKNKKPNWAIEKSRRDSLANPVNSSIEVTDSNSSDGPVVAVDESTALTTSTTAINTNVPTLGKDTTTPVTNVNQSVPETIIDVDAPPVSFKTKSNTNQTQKQRGRRRKMSYCCWSREKIEKFDNWRQVSKHKCPPVCKCCCQQDLLEELKRRRKEVAVKPYCCWSRQKIENLGKEIRQRTIHECQNGCQCCCKQQLVNEISKRAKIPENCISTNKDAIVLSDGEFDADSFDNDSNDVRIPGFDPPVPRLRVYSTKKGPKYQSNTSCSHTNSTCTSSCAGRGQPMVVAAVSATQVTAIPSVTTTVAPIPEDPQPLIRINVNFTPAPSSDDPAVQPVIPSISTSVDQPQTSLLQQIAAQITSQSDVVVSPLMPNLISSKVTIPVTVPPAINTSQRQIVIDASGPTTSIATNKEEERILFLNSKTLSKKPKESPIFLGKNKILLTTVKFPPNLDGNTPASEMPIQPAKVIPALPLPSGVQLVLMPDGQLSYTVDPAVQLDESQIALLPGIIAAVQQQINISNQQTTTAEAIPAINSIVPSTSKDEANTVESLGEQTTTEISNSHNAENITKQSQAQSNEVNIIEDSHKSNDASKKLSSTAGLPLSDTTEDESVNSLNSSKDSEIITVEERNDSADTNTTQVTSLVNNNDSEVNEGAPGSRNLLSDLMEMSGISTEDTKSQETAAQEAIPGNSSVPVVNLLETPVETTASLMHVVSTTGPVPITRPSDSISLPELSPITSLSELKYACDNNGLFFKLDLDTGVIAPINVCIKKNLKPDKPQLLRHPPLLGSKSVIDLTDDGEKETPINILKDGTVRPIKLIKRVVYHPASILNKKRKLQQLQADQQPKQHIKHKRKQNLQKIEAKIDLVDSDAPMEEEYLVDSSEPEDEMPGRGTTIVPSAGSDDSSDEEPLAKKFMRLKQVNNEVVAQEKDKVCDISKRIDDSKDDESGVPTEPQEVPNISIDLPVPIGPPTSVVLEADKDADNLNSDDMDIAESQFTPFMSEGNESHDEDCILGV